MPRTCLDFPSHNLVLGVPDPRKKLLGCRKSRPNMQNVAPVISRGGTAATYTIGAARGLFPKNYRVCLRLGSQGSGTFTDSGQLDPSCNAVCTLKYL